MAIESDSLRQSGGSSGSEEQNPKSAYSSQRVLMPREYYDVKHPWFGSQIHYTIDVFRQLICDARARKRHSYKDEC